MVELWRPVRGWEGLYEVSDLGRIRNRRTGRIKAQHRHGNQYLQVWLCNTRKNDKCRLVNRIVLEAFKGLAPSEDHEAAHNDGDPANNSETNLRWATHTENCADRELHGTLARGSAGYSILIEEDIARIREARLFGAKLKDLGACYGVHLSTISAACCGVSWNHV